MTEAPTTGTAVTIAPGVQWLRLEMGGPLGFINVWALDDGDGVALVDCGLGTEATAAAWSQAFAGPLRGRRVTRVFATHMHPDHIGMAGALTREHDCRLWITRLEYVTCRSLSSDTGRPAPPDGIRFYHAAGWGEPDIARYTERFGGFGQMLTPLPDSFRRIVDGESITIGEHAWQVVVGSGHSPEHACLWCPELRLLISGDQVLPRITSIVAVHPTEPEANPLDDWMRSLARIRAIVPDDVLVLPAHNDPFLGLHFRLDTLLDGHANGLAKLRALLAEAPGRVVDLFPALFRRAIDETNIGMATGECLAHLNYLVAAGEVVRTVDAAGVAWYALNARAEAVAA